MIIDFTLDLIPPETTAQQKGVSARGGKVRVFTKQEIKDIEAMYCAALAPHRPSVPLSGPVRAFVTFTFPWKESETKANRALGWMPRPTKPDAEQEDSKP